MNTAANYGGFILHGTITTTVTITTVVMMPAEPKTYKRKSTQFKPLTAMQEAYCQSYIKTPENQTQAAINAGFSPNTAAVKASVMMRDERIQKRIAELMEERNKRMRVSADYVLMRLVEIDQMDVIDILNDDGSLKPIREWPKIWRTTLSGFDLSSTIMNMNEDSIETILKKIKWPDKVKNLELIGKHVDVNAFKERLDVNVNVTIADRIAAARKRLMRSRGGKRGLNWHMLLAHVSGRLMRSERYVITCRIQRRAISRLCCHALLVTVLVNPHSSQC